MRRPAPIRSAFTLLELLVVMIIMALIAGAVGPSLAKFAVGRQANDAAVIIVSLARYAQTQAVSEGHSYRLNIDSASRSIWLTVGHGNTYTAAPNEFGKRFVIPTNVRLEAELPSHDDGQYVEFQSTGRVEVGTIRLIDHYNSTTVVSTRSITESYEIQPASGAK